MSIPVSFINLQAGESAILQSNGVDTHHVMGGTVGSAKNIIWNLKDTDANTTGAKVVHWQVPFDCTIAAWVLANPNNVNATTDVDFRRTTSAGYPATWDGSPLNTSPLGFSAGVINGGGSSDFATTDLNAGDWLRVEISTADATLTDLVAVLKVTV